MNKEKQVIFLPGEIVQFKHGSCNIIGVVVKDNWYKLPCKGDKEGHFNIKTLIKYSYSVLYASSFNTVGAIGGRFTHSSSNNLVKLTKRQIKRLGMALVLSYYA